MSMDEKAVWSAIKTVASKFPRHSMDLFIFAQEGNILALKSVFDEIKRDTDELKRLLEVLKPVGSSTHPKENERTRDILKRAGYQV